MPVHDLNLWLLFLLLSLPLLMAPKGKFLLQERGRKENPQKRRGGGGEQPARGRPAGADAGMLARGLQWGQTPKPTPQRIQAWVPIGPGQQGAAQEGASQGRVPKSLATF